MPTIIRCAQCGSTLAEWDGMPQDSVGGSGLISWYDKFFIEKKGECAVCGHKLPTPSDYAEKMKVLIIAVELVEVEK